MAIPPVSTEVPPDAPQPPPKALPPKVNPAFKYLGLPNFRPKLPSRNWLIFFGIVGTWTGLIIHDRREKKRIQADWCARVAHLSQAPLQINELPRKITIYLAAPPGDGIGAARDYFREYVKPVLVAAAVDYDVVEGRRGGEVRNAVGEAIRKWRRQNGGEKGRKAAGETLEDGEEGRELEIVRARLGIRKEVEDEESGVMVIGRHTWKEFVRGVHDGWLGPADSQVTELPPPREEGKPVPRPAIPRPTIEPEEYGTKPLPPSFPKESNSLPVCSPVAVVPYPHLLGFLNTPWRIYRYLNQRHLADQVARETAALCLGFSRPFQAFRPESLTVADAGAGGIDENVLKSVEGEVNSGDGGIGGEIDFGCWPEEEADWGKTYREVPPPEEDEKPKMEGKEEKKGDEEGKKVEELSEQQRYQRAVRRDAREWAVRMAVDGRIVGRMRRYDLPVSSIGNS